MKSDSCLSDQIVHMGLCKPEWPLLWLRVSCLQRAPRTLLNDPSFCLGFPRMPSFVFIAWTVSYGHCALRNGSRSAAAETCAVCSPPGAAWVVSWYSHIKCAVSILWQSCRHLWPLQRLSHSVTLTSWWRRKNYPTYAILARLPSLLRYLISVGFVGWTHVTGTQWWLLLLRAAIIIIIWHLCAYTKSLRVFLPDCHTQEITEVSWTLHNTDKTQSFHMLSNSTKSQLY